ncbi:hypothetical protein JYK14_10795 [Siccirubricoccus sp. KC 17139]|uniref:Uncharacterized protein n=1 Tax=Siccirubricoccus soli TaxID=2899147 RepID=A0ABT1D3Y9_9PROT|nr:hypothetical protein [Siccirubricoccus soli]MCO6416645.1 hypothetical protein [Siccirubricoccus soli]MCP2682780.1 hypothetical protein [Siccirubricoccus soli]
MPVFTAHVLLQCLGALLAWALIDRHGRTGPALLEAGFAWALPLVSAAAAGLTGESLTLVAASGILFNLANWGWQQLPR